MTAAEKPEPKFPAESRTVTYLPAGVGVDPYQGEPTLDPELKNARDAEIEANDVEVFSSYEEPTIDPALVKARDDQIAAEAKRAGVTETPPAKRAPAKKPSK